MDNKKRLILIIGGVVAVALVCVLIVGMLDGVWPWQNNGLDSEYTGIHTSGNDDTADSTGDAVINGTVDPTGTTAGNQGNSAGDGTGTENDQPQKPSVNVENDGTGNTEETLPDSAIIDFEDLIAGLNGNG